MKNEIIAKSRVTIVNSWDKVRVYLNKLHSNVAFKTLNTL